MLRFFPCVLILASILAVALSETDNRPVLTGIRNAAVPLTEVESDFAPPSRRTTYYREAVFNGIWQDSASYQLGLVSSSQSSMLNINNDRRRRTRRSNMPSTPQLDMQEQPASDVEGEKEQPQLIASHDTIADDWQRRVGNGTDSRRRTTDSRRRTTDTRRRRTSYCPSSSNGFKVLSSYVSNGQYQSTSSWTSSGSNTYPSICKTVDWSGTKKLCAYVSDSVTTGQDQGTMWMGKPGLTGEPQSCSDLNQVTYGKTISSSKKCSLSILTGATYQSQTDTQITQFLKISSNGKQVSGSPFKYSYEYEIYGDAFNYGTEKYCDNTTIELITLKKTDGDDYSSGMSSSKWSSATSESLHTKLTFSIASGRNAIIAISGDNSYIRATCFTGCSYSSGGGGLGGGWIVLIVLLAICACCCPCIIYNYFCRGGGEITVSSSAI